LPNANAVVNPNRMDETAGFQYMAAVGVTFVTLVGLSQKLKQNGITPPDLLKHLDLVALGTVCDVVPMVDLNRAFVAQGLKIMGRRENAGLKALADVAGLDQQPTTYHAGFVLGPRLNAGGRISSSTLGVTLLSSDDDNDTSKIALQLHDLNKERQEMEKRSVEEAMGIVARDGDKHSHAIIISSKEWHPGVIGLIAARIKEQFQRPTCVITIDKDGKGKASGRSINGVDLGALVIKAHQDGYILEGGGHAMAAGFSIAADKIDALHGFMQTELIKQFGPQLPPPEIIIDGTLLPAAVNMNVCNQLQQLEPFGPGYPSPKLVLSPVRLQRIDIVKEKHLRLTVTDVNNQQRLSVMMFGQANTPLHQTLAQINAQQKISILGSLKTNSWQGRTEAQFLADDIALTEDHG
jgi:single-stranded-DNA-specific exonuclease